MGTRLRIPLVDLALPQLKKLNKEQAQQFLETLEKLITCDHRYTLFEFTLFSLLDKQLCPQSQVKSNLKSFLPVLDEIALLLSLLCHASGGNTACKEVQFLTLFKTFSNQHKTLIAAKSCSAKQLSQSLQKLNQLNPMLKQGLIATCADAVIMDTKSKCQKPSC